MCQSVILNNGIRMPLIGLGTFRIKEKDEVNQVVREALECGYRSFDTATAYRNEDSIGEALKKYLPNYGLKRDDIFVTTKLGPEDQGRIRCLNAFNKSLHNLGLDDVDLYLIHWPGAQVQGHSGAAIPLLRRESWLLMEKLYKEGKVNAIGVSNYTIRHLEELLGFCSIKPAVNQVEYHPHLVQSDLLKFCQEHDIHLQAYSSLGTSMKNELLIDPVISKIATKNVKSSAQILLKWAVQQGIGVIPKSVHSEYIKSNIDIWDFTLDEDDLSQLNSLNKNRRYTCDPTHVL